MAMRKPQLSGGARRWVVVGALALGAFLASYSYAVARTSPAEPGTSQLAAGGGGATPAAGGAGCACCGGGAPGGGTTKAAEVAGDVQTITVDLSQGYYDPTTIELKAGIPAEITFGQGGGCLAQVQSRELGFFEDLSSGPRTVKVPALEAGTYSFECGMSMVSGSIVVK